MKYTITFHSGALREFDRLPKAARDAITRVLNRLVDDPRPYGVEKLATMDAYRARAGVYRIVYGIRDERLVIVVVQVGHRKDIYRALDVIRKRLQS